MRIRILFLNFKHPDTGLEEFGTVPALLDLKFLCMKAVNFVVDYEHTYVFHKETLVADMLVLFFIAQFLNRILH